MGQQRGEPRLIEQHLLMRRLPEGTDLLFLAPGGKSLLLDGQGNKRFEMLDFGIREACFPFPHRFSGDVQELGQFRLRQRDGDAQGQHGLPKGVVALAVRGSFHGRFPSVFSPKPQRWEGMRGGNATWCPVTSHTLTSILHTETIISPKAKVVRSKLSAHDRKRRAWCPDVPLGHASEGMMWMSSGNKHTTYFVTCSEEGDR